MSKSDKGKYRSAAWFGPADRDGFIHRSWMKNQGFPDDAFDEMVAEGHDLIETATFLKLSDPVFGSEVEKQFSHLFESVQERMLDEE